MAIKINFDTAHNPEPLTLILAKKNGDKLGQINAVDIEMSDAMNDISEISFRVYKYFNNVKCNLWDKITSFKLVFCVEWNSWFEIAVDIDESNETIKTVSCKSLGVAELSQINLYNIEINTEDDIARDEYDKDFPTVLYRPNDHSEASLLHRLLSDKAPHYRIAHVDASIANIQRMFSFDGTSIYDALQEIAEEIHCLFVFDLNSDEYGNLDRAIYVYDLESNCLDCGHRDEFTLVCPECGSENIDEGYGEDTGIFVTADMLAESLQLTSDTDSVKNCFKLEAGDDLMTASVRNCNPNGTDYIWRISDDMKEDMSDELVEKIESYDKLFEYYQKEHLAFSDNPEAIAALDKYNALVDKYLPQNEELEKIELPIKGYPALMNAYYDAIDFELYLESALMPTVVTNETDASKEAAKLTAEALSPVAAESVDKVTAPSADNIVLSMAKVLVDSTRYKVKVHQSSYDKETYIWTGCFSVQDFSATDEDIEEDKTNGTGLYFKISETISVEITDDYETFIKQKLDKVIDKNDVEDLSIEALFKMEQADFENEIKKYCLNRLSSFYDACQTCVDLLIEQGVADKSGWADYDEGSESNLYELMYVPFKNKLDALSVEMGIRKDEISLIAGSYDENGELVSKGLQNYLQDERSKIQKELNFEDYLGEELWLEFCSFRREDKYSNDNYISDGLNNAELFAKSLEFFNVANKEIHKASELQHSITTELRNLLVIEKFEPLVKDFKVGNWIRVLIDDTVYKLRLVTYSINYEEIDSISVEFSDSIKVSNSFTDIQSVLSQASSMATSYSSVKRQAKQGNESSETVNSWVDSGLDATNVKILGGADGQAQTWDKHGMLFREYDEITDSYLPEQLKIINSTIAVTDDNWKSTKTAIGKYYYKDRITGEMMMAYGVNAEVIIGKLLLGENIELTNENGTMSFNENGLMVSHGKNKVTISPQNESVIDITNGDESVFKVDEKGELTINGNIIARSLKLENGVEIDSGVITDLARIATTADYKDLLGDAANAGKVLSLDTSGGVEAVSISTVAKSGSYNDLTNKPQLKTVATSGSYTDLTNKPALKPVATSGSYTDLTGAASEAGKLLYVDTDGSITTLSIADLKKLLA